MQSRSLLSIAALAALLMSCVPGGGIDSPSITDSPPPGSEAEQSSGSEFGNPHGASEFGNPLALVTGTLNPIEPPQPPSSSAEPAEEPAEGLAYHVVTGPSFAAKTEPDSPPPPLPHSGFDSLAATPPKKICGVDQVQMMSSDGQKKQAGVGDDCSFRIEVTANKPYQMSFLNQGVVQSRLAVASNGGVSLHAFYVPESEPPLGLGNISRNGAVATAANDPRVWNDKDKDGTDDKYDSDDDNDGIPDLEESDCDLDGFPDDDDADSACSEGGSPAPPMILAASPYAGETDVVSTKKIRVKVSCVIEVGLFNSDRISIKDEADAGVATICFLYEGNTVIECEHANPFAPGTHYTATLGATVCNGGEILSEISWTFQSAP